MRLLSHSAAMLCNLQLCLCLVDESSVRDVHTNPDTDTDALTLRDALFSLLSHDVGVTWHEEEYLMRRGTGVYWLFASSLKADQSVSECQTR